MNDKIEKKYLEDKRRKYYGGTKNDPLYLFRQSRKDSSSEFNPVLLIPQLLDFFKQLGLGYDPPFLKQIDQGFPGIDIAHEEFSKLTSSLGSSFSAPIVPFHFLSFLSKSP